MDYPDKGKKAFEHKKDILIRLNTRAQLNVNTVCPMKTICRFSSVKDVKDQKKINGKLKNILFSILGKI